MEMTRLVTFVSIFRNWPQNTLLFELKDGYYTTPEVIRFVQGNDDGWRHRDASSSHFVGGVRVSGSVVSAPTGSSTSPSRTPSPSSSGVRSPETVSRSGTAIAKKGSTMATISSSSSNK